jgi:hypothetical protein
MRRARKQPARTERLNLCLSKYERRALARIAEREDRDDGYIASSFVAWAIEQYPTFGDLMAMRHSRIVREEQIVKNARGRKHEH